MRLWAAGLVSLTMLLAAGCGTGGLAPANADKSNGKQLFLNGVNKQASCGSCHTLADAGSLGKAGPNLDDAFRGSREQGFAESTIRNVVRTQIAEAEPPMPKDLVTSQNADDVAAYVASVAGLPVGGTSTTTGGAATTQATSTEQTTTQGTTTEATTTTDSTSTETQTETGGGGGKPDAALVSQGQKLYTSLGCIGCHSIDGSAGTGPTFKGLYDSKVKLKDGTEVTADEAYLLESMFDPDKKVHEGFQPGIMSAVIKPGSISQSDANALVAYIQSVK